MFDKEGKRIVTEQNIKEVFDNLGFDYQSDEPGKIIAMAGGHGSPTEGVSTA